jgi:hypothetical protein
MKTIPKPLLIVVIVLLVLTVVSCGMGLLGGRDRCSPDTDAGCKTKQKTELSGDGITNFLKGLIPGPPPVTEAGLNPAACAPLQPSSSTALSAFASCTITIVPTDDLRRRLRLRVDSGTTSIQVTQDVSGSTRTDTQAVPDGGEDTIDVVVGRRSGATVTVTCGPVQCGLSAPP